MASRAERRRRQDERARRGGAERQAGVLQAKKSIITTETPASLLSLLVLVIAGLYAFHNSLNGPFIFDDRFAIPANPTIRHLWPIWDALSPPGQGCAVAGRPVVNLSLASNYALGGLDVRGYHAVNLALHILTGLTLLGIVRRTLSGPRLASAYGKDATWLATAMAVLWLVHPLQTESVTYIVQRTELMMGLFFLLTLYSVIRGAASPNSGRWYAAAVVCCVLGMGSKEVMVVAPVLVLLYDRCFLAGSFREALRLRRGLYAGLAAGWLVLGALASTHPRSRSLIRAGLQPVTSLDYAKTQFGVIVHYLRLGFWPHPLVVDYDDWPIARTPADFLPWAAVLAALAAAAAVASRRRPWIGFLAAWFFVILAPTSTIVPIVTEVAAERRMYLPLAAIVVLVVVGLHAGFRRLTPGNERMLTMVIVIALTVALATATVRRNADYASPLAVWSDVVAKRPDNARARLNLGDYFYRHGQLKEAKEQFSASVRLGPVNPEAHYGLAVVLAGERDFAGAIAEHEAALGLRPGYADAHNGLGAVFAMQGRTDEAVAEYTKAVELAPDHANAHYNLGVALANQGRTEEAARHYQEALRVDPNLQPARSALDALRARAAPAPAQQ